MKHISLIITSLFAILLTSCATSSSMTRYPNIALDEYKYVVYGKEKENSEIKLTDVMFSIQNSISEVLEEVSPEQATRLVASGEKVLTPKISISSELWEGGQTFITAVFHDYGQDKEIVVVKSSGIGVTVSHDQRLALKGFKKELYKVFGK